MARPTTIRPADPLLLSESVPGDLVGDYEDDMDWPTSSGSALDWWKQPVRAATTGNVDITNALNAGDTVDDVVLLAGDRVLVKSQTDAAQNGIYAAGTTPGRAPDMDTGAEVPGSLVYVIDGTAHGGTTWRNTNTSEPILETDGITFAQLGSDSTDVTLATVAASGATETIDVTAARTYDITLTDDCTLTLTSPPDNEAWFLSLILRQDGTGGREVTWPGSVVWPGGTPPTLSTDPGDVDVFVLLTVNGGADWLGFPTGSTSSSLVADLDDLTDVVITTPAEGQTLYYRSGSWINEATPASRWELVVTGTAPPVALTNDDEDDFLYAEV